MALSGGVFHEGFAAALKPVIASSMLGTVLIERVVGSAEWSEDTGYAGGGTKLLYRGKARVQKVARPTRRENAQDAADSQVFTVQIMLELNEVTPDPDFEFYDNDRITIIHAPKLKHLEGVHMYLHNWPGSTNEVVTTLTCRYNAKQGKR